MSIKVLEANEVSLGFLFTILRDSKKSSERYLFWEIPVALGLIIKNDMRLKLGGLV